ncbi:Abi family protein [Paludibacterium yongneupense]|uniref:Abi family protein n=1 Tax=Paludibacterium yongneupense TaxID=400061 RepID=UPI0012EB865E
MRVDISHTAGQLAPFACLKSESRHTEFSSKFNRNGRIFSNWLRCLNYLRNVCAHHRSAIASIRLGCRGRGAASSLVFHGVRAGPCTLPHASFFGWPAGPFSAYRRQRLSTRIFQGVHRKIARHTDSIRHGRHG